MACGLGPLGLAVMLRDDAADPGILVHGGRMRSGVRGVRVPGGAI